MPFPRTRDMGKVMDFLKADKPTWPRKQKVAVALKITGKARGVRKRLKRLGA